MNTTQKLQTQRTSSHVAVHPKIKRYKMKKPFNPNDFDVNMTVADVAEKFEQLKEIDFSKVSLANEITKFNFEVVGAGYEDMKYSDIKDYYDIDVDTIV